MVRISPWCVEPTSTEVPLQLHIPLIRFRETYTLPENHVVLPGRTAYGPVLMGVQVKFVGGLLVMGPFAGAVAHMSLVALFWGGNQKISTRSPLIWQRWLAVQVGFSVRHDGVYGVFVKSMVF